MQVSFNPIKQNYSDGLFKKNNKEETSSNTIPTRDEIYTAKTKKIVSECKYIAIGAAIIYFAMKRNFKVNRLKNAADNVSEVKKSKKNFKSASPKKISKKFQEYISKIRS